MLLYERISIKEAVNITDALLVAGAILAAGVVGWAFTPTSTDGALKNSKKMLTKQLIN